MPDKLEVLPGPGLVARYNDVAVWAGPQASAALQVHLVTEAQRTGKGANGGDQLASSLIAILQRGDPEPQAPFAVVGPGANGLTLFLHGPVQAWDSGRWLAPQPVPGWMVTSVNRPWPLIVLPYGASPPPQSQQGNPMDLVVGAVPGSGFVMLRPPASGGQAAGAPQSATAPLPSPSGPAPLGAGTDTGPVGAGTVGAGTVGAGPVGAGPVGAGPVGAGGPSLGAAEVGGAAAGAGAGAVEMAGGGVGAGGVGAGGIGSAGVGGAMAAGAAVGAAAGMAAGGATAGSTTYDEPATGPAAVDPGAAAQTQPGQASAVGAAAPPPGTPTGTGLGATIVDLRNVFSAGRAPLPLASTAAPYFAPDLPQVVGVRCELGHFNHPRVVSCLRCGRPIAPGTPQVSGSRPPVGVLLADDGSIWALDRGCVIGADPGSAPEVQSGAAQPLMLRAGANHAMAPVQAEIQIRDWAAYLVDRGAEGGSWVQGPSAPAWEQLGRGEQRELVNGSHVSCGGRVLTYLSAWPS